LKSPKGFGKKYFTFASILAHAVSQTIESQISRIITLTDTKDKSGDNDKAEETELPPDILLQCVPVFQAKSSCHCNCFFNLKTKLAIHIFHYIPRCPYYTTYFAFRRTGVHPPLYNL
jgi:hypothetical protein